jgi:Skp family chaperone for outer membrane proteins
VGQKDDTIRNKPEAAEAPLRSAVQQSASEAQRRQREADALRRNLQRRKSQQRARRDPDPQDTGGSA